MCGFQPETAPPISTPTWFARLLVDDVKQVAIYSKWIGFASPPSQSERLILTHENTRFRRHWSPEEKVDHVSSDLVQQLLTKLSEQPVSALDVTQLGAAATSVQQSYESAWEDDYPGLLIEIHTSSGQRICLHSDVQHVFMLPLMLFQDSRFIGNTYDIHLSLAIAALMPEEFLGKDRLSGTNGWRCDDVPMSLRLSLRKNQHQKQLGPRPTRQSQHLDIGTLSSAGCSRSSPKRNRLLKKQTPSGSEKSLVVS